MLINLKMYTLILLTRYLGLMNSKEKIFDATLITNMLIAFALILSAIYYITNSNKIENEVITVIMNSVSDATASLAEQESTQK